MFNCLYKQLNQPTSTSCRCFPVKDFPPTETRLYWNNDWRAASNGLFKVVVWPDWHEHCSILQEPAVSTSTFCYRNHRSPSPHSVTSPSELYIDCCPCSPVWWVISCSSLKSFIGKFVAEVICDVPKMVCIKTKCFCRFNTSKCRWWGWKSVYEWTAKTPG